jgi:hypothetical protein
LDLPPDVRVQLQDIIDQLVVGDGQALVAEGRMLLTTLRRTRATLERYDITLGHLPDDALRYALVPPRTLDATAAPAFASPGTWWSLIELATDAGDPSGLWLECQVLVTPTSRSVRAFSPRPRLPDLIVPHVLALIRRVIAHDVAGLVAAGNSGTWDARDLQELLDVHERTRDRGAFIEPPIEAVRAAHVSAMPDTVRAGPCRAGRWRVELDMWTQDGYPSDLTLFVDVDSDAEGMALHIDDLYVL